jgi:hypothetical protein
MVEQRGITEYQLDLSEDEIENMLWHVYELYDISVDYKFLTNNCAFETLWLLEVARPNLNIVDRFDGIVPPYETISTLKEIGIVKSIQTQRSSIETIFQTYATLESEEKDFFRYLQSSDDKNKTLEASSLSVMTKDKMGYLINGYYDLLFKRYRIGKSDFDEVKAIPYTPHSELIEGEPSRRGGSKIELGYMKNHDEDWIISSLKPYSMNRLEDRFSILGDSTLEIMNIEFAKNSNKERIESLSVFNLESHTKRFDFYKPLSWKLQIGADRLIDDELNSVIHFGMGGSWGNENILGYIIPQINIYPIRGDIGLDMTAGIGFWYENIHVGVDYNQPIIYSLEEPRKKMNFYGVMQYSDVSLKVNHETDSLKISVMYQF